MEILFKRTRELERAIDDFLDLVVEGGLVFKQALNLYLEDRVEEFQERGARLRVIESRADALRREIEAQLYTHTLIPEARGDVLGLLEGTDAILNKIDENLKEIDVEQPRIMEEVRGLFAELCENAISALESMVMALRAYFREPSAIRDHINKCQFYEKEADRVADRLKRTVFSSDLDLSRKMHQRFFAHHIDQIADACEDLCDRLAIAAIKRSV